MKEAVLFDERSGASVGLHGQLDRLHASGGGGEHDGATCWIECSSCHGAVDAKDTYCKHCGAKFVLPFTEEDAYLEAMDIVQECKRGKS